MIIVWMLPKHIQKLMAMSTHASAGCIE